MQLNDLINKLSARLGYTIDDTSKPTKEEAESFIHEAIKKVVNILPVSHVDGLLTTYNLLVTGGTAPLPTDYNRFASMYNSTTSYDVDLLPSSKLASVMTGKDSIILPMECAVKVGDKLRFFGVADGEKVTLLYQRVYSPEYISHINDILEGAVLAYATYLCKVQDEEINDSQLAIRDFTTELQLLGVQKEVGTNE